MRSLSAKIIITGGPGTGKTSIIKTLESRGFSCYPEVARTVIAESLHEGSDVVPWLDHVAFGERVMELTLVNIEHSEESGLCFFDRGLPDTVAYFRADDIEETLGIPQLLPEIGYHNQVFYAPLWKEIYVADNERLESFDQAERIDNAIKETYLDLGFELVEIPKTSIEERTDFVLSTMSLPIEKERSI